MNEISYYEECNDLDEAYALVDELEAEYEGWTIDYTFDIRHDYVAVHFEAYRED